MDAVRRVLNQYLKLSSVLFVCFLLHKMVRYKGADRPRHTYDFVVVGGGTTGAVIAARLSEVPSVSVLLIEAGGEPSVLSDVPMLSTLQFNGASDWQYKTSPDGASCLGMVGGRCSWHRGKVIGGTSVINAMIYNRGA